MVEYVYTMELSTYDSQWNRKFQNEKRKLQEVFSTKLLAIEHIGSTAIPGLSSKPIIDIAVMIQDCEDVDSFAYHLEKLGYAFHSKSTERHFYQKGQPVEFHLSIAYADRGSFWPRQILFRDYLRAHQELLSEYANIKNQLIKQFPSGSGGYSDGKSIFVDKVLILAGWKNGQTYTEWLRKNVPLNK
jgi:GrpB-like predicted nucleotidyltransferase (UPF0157 family)